MFNNDNIYEPIHANFDDLYDDLPKSIDWRDIGAVTAVKDQGNCGSCYIFAAVDAVESHYFIKTNNLLTLSVQNILDFSHRYDCDGGLPDDVYTYMQDHGVYTEQSYPYNGQNHNFCKFGAEKTNVTVKGFRRIPTGSEKELQKALAYRGPVTVSIDTDHDSFLHIGEGIYHDPNCCSSKHDLDHVVLLVGYGTDDFGRDYYIAKNSYGSSWGEDGFFKISRNHMNHCGVATDAVYPII